MKNEYLCIIFSNGRQDVIRESDVLFVTSNVLQSNYKYIENALSIGKTIVNIENVSYIKSVSGKGE